MEIVSWEPEYRSPYIKTVLTVGNFDGVHLGHQSIFSSVIAKARELSAIPAVLTFNPHPQHFFHRGEPPLITTFNLCTSLACAATNHPRADAYL